MICFLIPLKSAAIANDWERVTHLFENTLRSAYYQTDADFRILVICHEIPKLRGVYDKRVEFLQVDFPPPTHCRGDSPMQDKWHKLAIGMIRAGKLNPDFFMFLDADDLVSRNLVKFVNNRTSANGWTLKHVYKYRYKSRLVHLVDYFNSYTVINSRLIVFPCSTERHEVEKCVALTHGHTIIVDKLAHLGTPLHVLPFRGAVYVEGHGDNDSHERLVRKWHGLRFFLGGLRRTRWMSTKLKREFSLV